jgi:hypothetical protein
MQNTEQMMLLGHKLWKRVGAPPNETEDGLLDQYNQYVAEEQAAGPTYLTLPDQKLQFLLLYGWAHYGFRQITSGHKLAAALMSTQISKDVLRATKPPWPYFLVNLPQGLLRYIGNDGEEVDATHTLIRYGYYLDEKTSERRMGWSHYTLTSSTTGVWYYHASPDILAGESSGKAHPYAAAYIDTYPGLYPEVESLDERSTALLWRYVLGLCLTMNDPDRIKSSKKAKQSLPSVRSRMSSQPVVRTYNVVGKPSYDCRESVKEYLEGKRKNRVTVQSVVCGHWKRQAHGPQRTERKTIWIEPYWRGPEDAAILVKPKGVGPSPEEE